VPTWARAILNITNIEKEEEGRWMSVGAGRRRHRGETAESEKRDATPDLFLKHPD
jgi:hypothetical protein